MSKPEPTTTTEPICYLLKCPNGIIIEIASYLKLRHEYTFLSTSHGLKTVFQDPILQSRIQSLEKFILRHIVDVEIVQLLLAMGASVFTPDTNDSGRCIMLCVWYHQLFIIVMMCFRVVWMLSSCYWNRGPWFRIILTNHRGYTAFECAIRSCHSDIVYFLRLKQEGGHG